VLHRLAPEELVVLPRTAQEFFDDPQALLDPDRRDEALGFGIDMALLTPYVLAVGGPVLGYLASVVGDAAKNAAADAIKPMISARVRALLRRPDSEAAAPPGGEISAVPGAEAVGATSGGLVAMPALSGDQARHVRDLVRDRARSIGLPDTQADLLADAFVGSLVVGD
jgi:hypothetical protein